MSKQDKNCQIPTPARYVERMLDLAGYQSDLYGKKVLENSCGEGNILIEIVRRYIADAKRSGFASAQIAEGLERDITAYEIDPQKAAQCAERLHLMAAAEQLPEIRWNIVCADFLRCEEQKADYIIGNPPYITYHDLKEEERRFLKKKYDVCKAGRFDYCYAFIEAGIKSLKINGKMIYLIPFSIFRNKFAANLRTFLRGYITKIIDYRSVRLFPGIICSAAMIVCQNGMVSDHIEYEDVFSKKRFGILRTDLNKDGEKWIFDQPAKGRERFGDYFCVRNSVATLCNKAFLFSVEAEQERYYVIDGKLVERAAALPAVSTKSSRAREQGNAEMRIIFPYNVDDQGRIGRFEENEFRQRYPYTWEYLHQFYEDLCKRAADENAKWFEYGRSQALTGVFGEKLVMPMVITNTTRLHAAGEEAVPYAGYFIKAKAGSNLTLEDAKNILESSDFYQYAKEVGTPTTVSSYRVSVKDINEYMF